MRSDAYIVLYDGVCHFCNGSVQFIIKRDPEEKFVFAPIQSELAKQLMQEHCAQYPELDSLVLIKHGRCYLWSDAALEITRDLTGFWYLFWLFKVVPRVIRDYGYRCFARHRYRLFGRRESCLVPDARLKRRFLGI